MIGIEDYRIKLCTTYVEDGKKKAVIQLQTTLITLIKVCLAYFYYFNEGRDSHD